MRILRGGGSPIFYMEFKGQVIYFVTNLKGGVTCFVPEKRKRGSLVQFQVSLKCFFFVHSFILLKEVDGVIFVVQVEKGVVTYFVQGSKRGLTYFVLCKKEGEVIYFVPNQYTKSS